MNTISIKGYIINADNLDYISINAIHKTITFKLHEDKITFLVSEGCGGIEIISEKDYTNILRWISEQNGNLFKNKLTII